MRRPIPATPAGRYQLGAAASLVVALLIGFMTFAPSASAHHPEISGSTACVEDEGGYTVAFDSVSWQTSGGDAGGGANPHIDIAYRFRTDGGSPTAWTTLTWESGYRYTAENDYRFADTFPVADLSAGNQVQIRATAVSPWGNGRVGGQTTSTGWLSFPTDCRTPGTPSVGGSVACVNGNGDVTVTLANTAAAGAEAVLAADALPVIFVVTDPRTGATTTRTLAPGASDAVVLAGFPDGPITIPVTADGVSYDQTHTVDCDVPGVPSVTASLECVDFDGVVEVTLANVGGTEAIVFVVTDPRDGTTITRTVPVGASATVTLTGLRDGPSLIGIAVGTAILDRILDIDCDQPAPPTVTVAMTCATGGQTVTIANTGSADATVSVRKDGEPVAEVVVPAGGEAEVVVPLSEDETATITVVAGEVEVAAGTVTQDCQEDTTTTSTTVPEPTTVATSVTTIAGQPSAQALGIDLDQAPVVQQASLPATGSNLLGLLMLGGALVVFGFCVVQVQRRRG